MPTTYNGIGTRYSGKRNLEARHGVCQLCNRETTLESYDTRLWFVFFFIPLIPLGHKRVLNACPVCSGHQFIDLDKWETAKQLSISGALEKFHSTPSPEAAVEVHQQLIGFHQTAQADEFVGIITEKYPDHANLHAYLGTAMEELGRIPESVRYFSRSLQLRPDLPGARIGVAGQCLRENKLDEARTLLSFLEQPGASQLYTLAPLETLADALQAAGRHEEALDLYGQLLAAYPAVGEVKGFRERIKRSEKALGRRESLLPKKKFAIKNLFGGGGGGQPARQSPRVTLRGAATVGLLLLLLCIGLAIGNEYVRRHRTLYVVNATGAPATVTIRGIDSIIVGKTVAQLELSEGLYHVSVTGKKPEEFDIEIRADYFDRWSDDPAWVVNVGGEALLMRQRVTYASRNPAPPSFLWSFGTPFASFKEVTHPFKGLPTTMRLKSGETRTLSRLEVFEGTISQALSTVSPGDLGTALRMAEWRLERHPDDEETLTEYVTRAVNRNQSERVVGFLEAGLSRRPVPVQWHRMYQNLHGGSAQLAKLIETYDRMLQSEPGNSELLYLRGRIDPKDSKKWYAQALAADAANPYAHMALGYERMSAGDWTGARPLFARAVELKPEDEQFQELLWQTRLALGRFTELEKEGREKIQREPLNFPANQRLCTLLAAHQPIGQARAILTAFERRLRAEGAEASPAIAMLRRSMLYAAGDFASLQKECAADRTPEGRGHLFAALVEQGRLAEAARIHPLDDARQTEPYHFLAMSLAWSMAGEEANATAWFERGVKLLAGGESENTRVAALLESASPPAAGELEAITIGPNLKAIIHALLAVRHPARRAEFKAACRRMNVPYDYPYHLLQRASEGSPIQ